MGVIKKCTDCCESLLFKRSEGTLTKKCAALSTLKQQAKVRSEFHIGLFSSYCCCWVPQYHFLFIRAHMAGVIISVVRKLSVVA